MALLRSDEILIASESCSSPKCGVYFLIHDGQIMYVGQSVNIDGRLGGHRLMRRNFDRYHWIACAREELNALERAYIDAFLPPWNTDPRTESLRLRLKYPLPAELRRVEALRHCASVLE